MFLMPFGLSNWCLTKLIIGGLALNCFHFQEQIGPDPVAHGCPAGGTHQKSIRFRF